MGYVLLRSGPQLGDGMVRQYIDDPPFRVMSNTFINEIWQSKEKQQLQPMIQEI